MSRRSIRVVLAVAGFATLVYTIGAPYTGG
jgi:hypothetical protein